MADFGDFAKLAKGRHCRHFWSRGLRQNVLRWLRFKSILISRSRDSRQGDIQIPKLDLLFGQFSLVPPLENLRKWPIFVTLLKMPKLDTAGTFGAAVCAKMFSDDWYALKAQSSENILAQTAAPKVPAVSSFGQFSKVTKSAIFWDFPKGRPREKCSKKRSTSGARKSLWREPRDLLISMDLKRNHRRTFWRKPRLKKCRQCRALANLAKSPKSAIFWDYPKGTKGKLPKK